MSIDPERDKPFDYVSGMNYCLSHNRAMSEFLGKFRKADSEVIAMKMLKHEPEVLAEILKTNYEHSEHGKQNQILDMISKPGTFTLILGLPRHGKTASFFWAAEQWIEQGKDVYMFGYSPYIAKYHPKIRQTFDLYSIENGIVGYDELLMTLFSRQAMTREVQDRIQSFPTAGHHDLALVGLSQSIRVDALLRDLLTYVWFKPFVITSMFEKTLHFKPYVKYLMPAQKSENLLFDVKANKALMFSNKLPEVWSDELSKTMARIKDKKEALKYARMLKEAKMSDRDISKMLRQRGIDINDVKDELDILSCPTCGSTDMQRYGLRGDKQRYKCNGCGAVFNES